MAVHFALICAFYSLLGAVCVKLAFRSGKNKKKLASAVLVFICSIMVFIYFHGTIPGNLTSKAINEEYLTSTYPEGTFPSEQHTTVQKITAISQNLIFTITNFILVKSE